MSTASTGKISLMLVADQQQLTEGLSTAEKAVDNSAKEMAASLGKLYGQARQGSIAPKDIGAALDKLKGQLEATVPVGPAAFQRFKDSFKGEITKAILDPVAAARQYLYDIPARLGAGMARAFTQPIASMNALLAKAKALGGMVSGAMKSLAAIPLIGQGFGALNSLFGFFTADDSKFSQIAKIGKMSDRLGLDTEFVSALAATGVSTEELEKATRSLARTLHGVKIEGEDATSSLDKFGLDTEAIARAGPQEALKILADKLHDLPPGFERAALGAATLGRNNEKLVQYLSKGRIELEKMVEGQKRLGTAFSRSDASAIEQGQKAIKEMNQVLEGAKTQLAIGIAPYVTAIAKSLSDWIKSGPPISDMFRKIGKWIGEAAIAVVSAIGAVVLSVVDAWAEIKPIFDKIKDPKSIFVEGGNDPDSHWYDLFVGDSEKIYGDAGALAGVLAKVGESGTKAGKSIKDRFDEVQATLQASVDKIEKTGQAMDDLAKRNAGKSSLLFDLHTLDEVSAKLDKIKHQLATDLSTFGKPGRAKQLEEAESDAKAVAKSRLIAEKDLQTKIWQAQGDINRRGSEPTLGDLMRLVELQQELAKVQGAAGIAEARIAEIKALDRALTQLEKWSKAMDEAKKIHEESLDPMDKLDEHLGQLNLLLASGTLEWEDYEKAINKAGKEASDALAKQNEFVSPKAIVRGSAEEFALLLRRDNEAQQNPNKGVEDKLSQVKEIMGGVRSELQGIHGDLIRGAAVDLLPN